MIDFISLLIQEKIADNNFRAAAIVNGLKLLELGDDKSKILARARLYRDWRNSKIYGSKTTPCFEKAIAGEAVPQIALISEALHTEVSE